MQDFPAQNTEERSIANNGNSDDLAQKMTSSVQRDSFPPIQRPPSDPLSRFVEFEDHTSPSMGYANPIPANRHRELRASLLFLSLEKYFPDVRSDVLKKEDVHRGGTSEETPAVSGLMAALSRIRKAINRMLK
jgi:hypothetical protein